MQTEWKYIVVRGTLRPGQVGHGYAPVSEPTFRDHPILFPKTLMHAEMYDVIRFQDTMQEQLDNIHVVAAGFCYADMHEK